MMRARQISCAFGLAALVAGCSAVPESDPALDLDPEDGDPSIPDGKAEAWDQANNPTFVDSTFLTHVTQLPLAGEGPKPITSDYWGVYKDNLNVKWDGAMSPAEKYARAFGMNVRDVQNAVSYANGVKGHAERRSCQTTADCASLGDGSECATSFDGEVKRCIPTWWGICHGWAPYALSEPQAKSPVTRRAPDGTSITFYPADLEALMSLLYTDIDSKFLAARCNRGDGLPVTITTDNGGRIIERECRDSNPGTWHVLTTNMMGLRKKGFVIDQTTDYQVWNQPGWKYQIVNAERGQLKEVSRAEALALLGQSDGAYVYNSSAKKFFYVEMDFTFVVESRPSREPRDGADYSQTKRYRYVLETDDDGGIVGGEWVGDSRGDHPDFVWWATSAPNDDVAGIRYADVRALNDESAGAAAAADRETLMENVALPHTFWSRSKYVDLSLPAGFRRVTLTMTGTGAARLMVGPKGRNPRIGWSNLCDARAPGTANQTCSFDVDPAGGVYHVRARSEQDGTVVSIVADKIRN